MSQGYRELDGDDISDLLGELLDRLSARGVEVDAYLIGGAAIALHLGREQLTPDVDGLFRPRAEVFAEAAAMAREKNLDPTWVNDRALSFIAFDPAEDVEAKQVVLRGHKVTIASKRVLLAMKIAASRPKDREDTSRLIADLGITSPHVIVDLAFSVLGEHGMTLPNDREEVYFMAAEALGRANRYAAHPGFSEDAFDRGGLVWVQPHVKRSGKSVAGYWRSRPTRQAD